MPIIIEERGQYYSLLAYFFNCFPFFPPELTSVIHIFNSAKFILLYRYFNRFQKSFYGCLNIFLSYNHIFQIISKIPPVENSVIML